MKYFDEVETLFSQFPGRRFRTFQITRSVAKSAGRVKPDEAMRIQVHRVLAAMVENGFVHVVESRTRGGFNVYSTTKTVTLSSVKP